MNAPIRTEALTTHRGCIEAVVEPLPPMVYRSEGFAEDLEPEPGAVEGLARWFRADLGAWLYTLPLGLALLGACETTWIGGLF